MDKGAQGLAQRGVHIGIPVPRTQALFHLAGNGIQGRSPGVSGNPP
ncbi:MAG: hypothetical protein PWP17_1622, partial [Desulfomicrobiaceae bacterium]|nr:hypothetical protein [Desulfomicrobiaceae bacterium]